MCQIPFVSVFIVGVLRMSEGSCDDIHQCMKEHDWSYNKDMINAENYDRFWDKLCRYSNKKLLVDCIDAISDQYIYALNVITTNCEPVDEYYPVDLKYSSALDVYHETCSDKDALKEFKECFKKPKMKVYILTCLKCPQKAVTKSKCKTQAVSNKPSNSSGCSVCQYMQCLRQAMIVEECKGKAIKIYNKSVKVLCRGSKIYIELVVLVGLSIVSCLFGNM